MVKDKGTPPGNEDFEDDVIRKLDSSMRRLLKLSDAEIRKEITRERRTLFRKRKKIEEDLRRLPPAASDADKKAVARIMQMRRSELVPRRDLVAVIPDKMRPVRIRAIVHYTGNRADLEAMGIEVRSQAQDVFTIVGTRKQLKDLANQPACRRLRTPRMLFPTVEHASAQAEVANVHDPRPLNPNGFRGNGVLVGIIDSALDVTHHGFRDPNPLGTHDTRVLYYWVQTPYTLDGLGNPVRQANPPGQTPQAWGAAAPGRPAFNGLNYGRLYTQNDINTAIGAAIHYGTANNQICCVPDIAEHGTHCAGIAVGSGHVTNWNTNPIHEGAAPQATIIYVCNGLLTNGMGRDGTTEDFILDAIDFCMQAAAGMPIVISISQGNNLGPHNGMSDYDQGRDNFLNSFDNRSIVWSAGNDNNDNGYRTGTIAAGAIETLTLTAERNLFFYLDVWYSGPELDYRITHGGVNSGWRTAGQGYTGNLAGQDIEAVRDPDPSGGLRGIRLYFDDARLLDTYTLELRNPHAIDAVNYHAWTGSQGWWASINGSSQNTLTLSDSGCARSILTVGAAAKVRPPTPATGEQITNYSAAGPTLDGRIKPEVVAVGGTLADPVISAASDQNSGYVGMFGTSMATPLVAGAVALLFEEYGSPPPVGLGRELNQDTIKALITQYANRLNLHLDPSQPDYVAEERNRYGYGRLRMIGPIDHIRPPIDIDLWIRTADDDYGEEPYLGGCFCGAPDIRVFQAGTTNETTQIIWGTTYDVRVTVRNLGDTDAVGATVRLKYTLPHAAPSEWFEAEDASNNKLRETVTVPAVDSEEVVFHWRPEAAELGAPAGTTHYCLLAEVDHAADPLFFPAPTSRGGTAWSTNIKSTNNVALRNLHIQ
jgi:subtilisin family serine protease